MKKLLAIALIGTCFCSMDVSAAARKDCSYSPLQDIIRTARDEKDIQKLLEQNVNFNMVPRCGGDVLQLAIMRGNPQVLKVLLESADLSVDKMVPNVDYPIEGAPKEIPFLAFAAYYAPRADMMNLVLQASENVFVEDARKESLLWYMRRNPVLMNTALYDDIRMKFLLNQTKKDENKGKSLNDVKEDAPADTKTEAKSNDKEENIELVEPDRKFNPDAHKDVVKTDI